MRSQSNKISDNRSTLVGPGVINISDNDLPFSHVSCHSQLATAITRSHEYSTAVVSPVFRGGVGHGVDALESPIKHSSAVERDCDKLSQTVTNYRQPAWHIRAQD